MRLLRGFDRDFVRNHLFVKIVLVFCTIAVLIIAALSYVTYYFISQSLVRNELQNQKNAMERVNHFIAAKYDSVQMMLQNVYRDQQLADNVTFLLKNSFEDYVKHGLDQYYRNGNPSSRGMDYFRNAMEDDPDIVNLLLYSTDKQFLYVNGRTASPKMIEAHAARSYIPDAMALQKGGVAIPNEWLRKATGQWQPRLFSIQSTINDMWTLKTVGQLLVYFDSDAIRRDLAKYGNGFKGAILVLAPDGQVVFDSSGRYYGNPYPYMDKLHTLTGSGKLEEESYITTLTPNNLGYIVVGTASKREVATAYTALKRLIITISGICIFIAMTVPPLFVIRLSKRTNRIIRSMRKVETGDMSVRIQDSEEDEIGQISRGFNTMMNELTRYIDRVYKADIKQKESELTALQARINPHFLYNTLEVIRMRAISQGVHDVSDMIYSLANLFKSFVRQKPVVTLREELENGRLYLELFRIRYKEKFGYSIELEPGLEDRRIVKMCVQPLIENAIVHGMKNDGTDRVEVRAVSVEDGVRITVSDNGKGMPPERLEELRQTLRQEDASSPGVGSIGLRNVHDRLRMLYGPASGIEIDSQPGRGTMVTLHIQYSEEGEPDHV